MSSYLLTTTEDKTANSYYEGAIKSLGLIKKRYRCSISATRVLDLYEVANDEKLKILLPNIHNALIRVGVSQEEAATAIGGIRGSAKFYKECAKKRVDGDLKCGYVRVVSQKIGNTTTIAISAIVAEAHLGFLRWVSTTTREEITQNLFCVTEYTANANVHNKVLQYIGSSKPKALMIEL